MKLSSSIWQAYRAQQKAIKDEEQLSKPPLTWNSQLTKGGQMVQLQVPVNSETPPEEWTNGNTVKKTYPVLSINGSAEDFCYMCQNVDTVVTAMGQQDEIARKVEIFKQMLDSDCLEKFADIHNDEVANNEALALNLQMTETEVFIRAKNEFARDFFADWKNAQRKQKRYMRKQAMPQGVNIKTFCNRLQSMSRALKHFPFDPEVQPQPYQPLSEDDLIEVVDNAKNPAWNADMARDNKNADSFRTLTEIKDYFSRLEESYRLKQDAEQGRESETPPKKTTAGKRKGGQQGTQQGKRQKKAKPCKHCGKTGLHKEQDCWELESNKEKRPPNWKSSKQGKDETSSVVQSDQNIQAEIQKDKKRLRITNAVSNHGLSNSTVNQSQVNSSNFKKRKRSDEEDAQTTNAASTDESDVDKGDDLEVLCPMQAMLNRNDNSSSSEDFDGYLPEFLLPFFNREHLHKKAKVGHYTAEIIVEILDRNNNLVPIRALLDTGTSSSILLRDYVKKGRASGYSGKKTTWKTMGGNFTTKKKALVDFTFPELNPNKKITWVCHVDDTTDKDKALYDMIIGLDLMTEIGVFVDTEEKVIRWGGDTTPMGMRGAIDENTIHAIYQLAQDTPILQQAEERHKRILDADYSAVDIDNYVQELQNLTSVEKKRLKALLHKFPKLFQGGLGVLDVPPVHLELKPDAKPFHSRAFPVPQAYKETTKREINRLEAIGVLKRSHDSEWAAPMFIQPKKTGDVRVLVDFRRLNDMILRKPFPLPKIQDMLQSLSGFTYATAIDLSMGYYHIPLDAASQKLCTMTLPWGKYQWTRLPMGVKCAPDVFQSIISGLFSDLEHVRGYIDDILVTSSGDFQDHLTKLAEVLRRLQKAGFRANVKKCFFARTEIEYLGYWLTRKGIQPQPKKVEAILRLKPPRNVCQLRHFLGMVNFYRNMWRRRSHLLAPLTALVGKKSPWKWGPEQQEAFDQMKAVMSEETLLAFPDFNKEFHIYTDASDYQLGAVIMQEGQPLAFYSRKLNDAQKGTQLENRNYYQLWKH